MKPLKLSFFKTGPSRKKNPASSAPHTPKIREITPVFRNFPIPNPFFFPLEEIFKRSILNAVHQTPNCAVYLLDSAPPKSLGPLYYLEPFLSPDESHFSMLLEVKLLHYHQQIQKFARASPSIMAKTSFDLDWIDKVAETYHEFPVFVIGLKTSEKQLIISEVICSTRFLKLVKPDGVSGLLDHRLIQNICRFWAFQSPENYLQFINFITNWYCFNRVTLSVCTVGGTYNLDFGYQCLGKTDQSKSYCFFVLQSKEDFGSKSAGFHEEPQRQNPDWGRLLRLYYMRGKRGKEKT